MSGLFYPLSDDDVRQIALLVETLDKSSLDFLELELGDTKLTIGKGEMPVIATRHHAASSATRRTAATVSRGARHAYRLRLLRSRKKPCMLPLPPRMTAPW